MHSFQKLFQILAIFKPYYSESDLHKESTKCKCVCVGRIDAFIANLGQHFWGSQPMQELTSGMRNVLPVLIRDAHSCIDCHPHKRSPRFAMNASIFIPTHSCAFIVLSLRRSLSPQPRFEIDYNLKFILGRKKCIKAKKDRTHLCLQNHTNKIVLSSARMMHYQNLNVIHKPIVKYYINDEKCKIKLTPSTSVRSMQE